MRSYAWTGTNVEPTLYEGERRKVAVFSPMPAVFPLDQGLPDLSTLFVTYIVERSHVLRSRRTDRRPVCFYLPLDMTVTREQQFAVAVAERWPEAIDMFGTDLCMALFGCLKLV